MALGGGNFTIQNKSLPGAYMNFVSVGTASTSSADRGVATMPLSLDWGSDDTVVQVDLADFQKNTMQLFGYSYSSDELLCLREVFQNAKTVYVYRLNSGTVAENAYAVAKHSGVRGNDIQIAIQMNVEDDSLYDVSTMLGTTVYDIQTVETAEELVANDWVSFKADAELLLTVATPLSGGSNGEVSGASHQAYLQKIEKFSFNAMGVVTDDSAIKSLYLSFVKRMRDEVGVKFQLVLFDHKSDYEGAINVKNGLEMVPFTTGVIAGCEVNQSNSNKIYNGECDVFLDYTQTELATSIASGEFVFHQVGDDVRILEDINSLVTTSDDKNDLFKDNQTIRVIDQIATDLAVLFATKYLGVIQNDDSGRISLWADIVKHHEELERVRAIEDFDENDVVVTQGNTKKEVVVSDAVTVVNAMNKLYMTVTVG